MGSLKVIARYRDGRMVKGTTNNFWPGTLVFHIRPADAPDAAPVVVAANDLKAIFVVHSFEGNPRRIKQAHFKPADRPYGQKLRVTFQDGEVLDGSTANYDPAVQGFFVWPADQGGNNEKIYVLNSAVKSVRRL